MTEDDERERERGDGEDEEDAHMRGATPGDDRVDELGSLNSEAAELRETREALTKLSEEFAALQAVL